MSYSKKVKTNDLKGCFRKEFNIKIRGVLKNKFQQCTY